MRMLLYLMNSWNLLPSKMNNSTVSDRTSLPQGNVGAEFVGRGQGRQRVDWPNADPRWGRTFAAGRTRIVRLGFRKHREVMSTFSSFFNWYSENSLFIIFESLCIYISQRTFRICFIVFINIRNNSLLNLVDVYVKVGRKHITWNYKPSSPLCFRRLQGLWSRLYGGDILWNHGRRSLGTECAKVAQHRRRG